MSTVVTENMTVSMANFKQSMRNFRNNKVSECKRGGFLPLPYERGNSDTSGAMMSKPSLPTSIHVSRRVCTSLVPEYRNICTESAGIDFRPVRS